MACALVAFSTWLTAAPSYSIGSIVNYGADYVVEANAAFHGYRLDGYAGGIAVMSPADLGRALYLKVPGFGWSGPYLAVDVAAQIDFCDRVYHDGEIAEAPRSLMSQWGAAAIIHDAEMLRCGNEPRGLPRRHRDIIKWEFREGRRWLPYPPQQFCPPVEAWVGLEYRRRAR